MTFSWPYITPFGCNFRQNAMQTSDICLSFPPDAAAPVLSQNTPALQLQETRGKILLDNMLLPQKQKTTANRVQILGILGKEQARGI